jgi:hypothetical protein
LPVVARFSVAGPPNYYHQPSNCLQYRLVIFANIHLTMFLVCVIFVLLLHLFLLESTNMRHGCMVGCMFILLMLSMPNIISFLFFCFVVRSDVFFLLLLSLAIFTSSHLLSKTDFSQELQGAYASFAEELIAHVQHLDPPLLAIWPLFASSLRDDATFAFRSAAPRFSCDAFQLILCG